MSTSIALPTDGSLSALRCARWLGKHAVQHDVTITVIHVMTLLGPTDIILQRSALLESESILEATEDALRCCPSVETISLSGEPGPEIVQFVAQRGLDLIVMGRRYQSADERDSVSRYVMRHSPVPVMIVGPPK